MNTVAHVERLAPGARAGHTAVRAGSSVLIWGGFDEPVSYGATFAFAKKVTMLSSVWLPRFVARVLTT